MSWLRRKPKPEMSERAAAAILALMEDDMEARTPIGATFGPWADHAPRCKCNVCR